MDFAEDMKNLGESLVSSFANRIRAVKDLRVQCHEDQKKRIRTVKDLTDSELMAARERKKFCKANVKYVADFLDDFVLEHNKMTNKQNHSLHNFVKELTNSELGSAKERKKFCEANVKYVADFLDDFVLGHNKMSEKQKQYLQGFVKELTDSELMAARERKKFCKELTDSELMAARERKKSCKARAEEIKKGQQIFKHYRKQSYKKKDNMIKTPALKMEKLAPKIKKAALKKKAKKKHKPESRKFEGSKPIILPKEKPQPKIMEKLAPKIKKAALKKKAKKKHK